MDIIEILKAILLGVVEGITEWLPISSTGHMILVDEFIKLNMSPAFMEMFFVVIQLGAIMAVVVLYWRKLNPFVVRGGKMVMEQETILMWMKIVVSCVPAAIVGLLWDDELNALFYNYQTVAIMLVVFGIFFIVIENVNKNRRPTVNHLRDITFTTAFLIGIFQLIAAVFPGTSRSGATILGGLMLGVSRTIAAEYTFFLAIPVMFGASALKLVKFGLNFTGWELLILIVGMVVAYVVSILAIKFLMGYIKKNDFKVFGWYRIVLGIIVILYFQLVG